MIAQLLKFACVVLSHGVLVLGRCLWQGRKLRQAGFEEAQTAIDWRK